MSLTSRRSFLNYLTAASGVFATTAIAPRPLRAIERIQRNGAPKFKFSLAAYSYEKLLTGPTPQLTLEDFLQDCMQMQLDGAELTSYYFPTDPRPAYLRKLKGMAFRLGLDVSGTAVGNDFCHPAGPLRQEQIALVKQWIDYAELLDAPVIRIFSGTPHDTSPEEAHRLAVEGIEECCQYSGERGIFLALENHGGLTETPASMLRLVEDVKSDWFGVNLDTGNFHGTDVYADLAKIAPYAINVQVKVGVSGPDGQKHPSDFSKLASLLTDAGYRGYIVLEYEDSDDPRTACPRYVDQIREAFKAS